MSDRPKRCHAYASRRVPLSRADGRARGGTHADDTVPRPEVVPTAHEDHRVLAASPPAERAEVLPRVRAGDEAGAAHRRDGGFRAPRAKRRRDVVGVRGPVAHGAVRDHVNPRVRKAAGARGREGSGECRRKRAGTRVREVITRPIRARTRARAGRAGRSRRPPAPRPRPRGRRTPTRPTFVRAW